MKFLQVLILIFGLTAFANAQKAILSGIVYDSLGAVIPNAKIQAKNSEGKVFTAYTNDDGHYQLKLAENAYQIEITFSILNKFTVSDYWIMYKMQLDAVLQCKGKCKIIGDPIITSEKPSGESLKKQNKTKRKNKD